MSLLELMVTIAIAGILLGMAVPSFQRLMQTNRMAAAVNDLQIALATAKSESVKRGVRTTVCRSANAETANPSCGGGAGWEAGWLVFAESNAAGSLGTRDAGEEVLLVHGALAGGVTIRGNANVANRVTFNTRAMSPGFNGTLTVCDPRGANDAHAVVLTPAGRSRVDDNPSGASCPS